MSAIYNKSRREREPLSPETIASRIVLAIFVVALLFSLFVFPWMFS